LSWLRFSAVRRTRSKEERKRQEDELHGATGLCAA
jgi:hypothetical protein